jgi:hypothetical protein
MEEEDTSMAVVTASAALVALLVLMLPQFGGAAAAAAAATTAGSNCTISCGNISIPYPFGVELGCYHAIGFNLTCRHGPLSHHGPPKLFLGDGTVQVLDISVEHSTVRINSTGVQLSYYDKDIANSTISRTWGLGLPESGPFFLSESTSVLEAIGCNIQVSIMGGVGNRLVSSCSSICPLINLYRAAVGNGSCTGITCCQASIILGYSFYNIQINLIPGPQYFPPSVYIVDQRYNFDADMFFGHGPKALPATLDWIINNSTCPTNMPALECRSTNSYCQNSSSLVHGGYLCQCSKGYQGNPYVKDGCQGTQ